MDLNWKHEEVLMAVRDGIFLTPQQEARLKLAEQPPVPGGPRRAAASILVALARRLDPESAARSAWPTERVQGRPA